MPFRPPEDHGEAFGYSAVLIMTLLAAFARILHRVVSGHKVSLLMAFAQIVMSTLASALMLFLSMRFRWEISATVVVCGLASWSGVIIVILLEKKFLSRLSSSK
ncbi:hypothetical protein GJV07_02110 [Enterobacteriaceae bacterium RIT711]|nr:hypothetical protein [Enterobacteriaceae bacterium RIT711]